MINEEGSISGRGITQLVRRPFFIFASVNFLAVLIAGLEGEAWKREIDSEKVEGTDGAADEQVKRKA